MANRRVITPCKSLNVTRFLEAGYWLRSAARCHGRQSRDCAGRGRSTRVGRRKAMGAQTTRLRTVNDTSRRAIAKIQTKRKDLQFLR